MELTRGDKRFLIRLLRHLTAVCEGMPYDVALDNKTYNALRLLRREDVKILGRKVARWCGTEEKEEGR